MGFADPRGEEEEEKIDDQVEANRVQGKLTVPVGRAVAHVQAMGRRDLAGMKKHRPQTTPSGTVEMEKVLEPTPEIGLQTQIADGLLRFGRLFCVSRFRGRVAQGQVLRDQVGEDAILAASRLDLPIEKLSGDSADQSATSIRIVSGSVG